MNEEIQLAAQITRRDLEPSKVFWVWWGTPLVRALLDAQAEQAVTPQDAGAFAADAQ